MTTRSQRSRLRLGAMSGCAAALVLAACSGGSGGEPGGTGGSGATEFSNLIVSTNTQIPEILTSLSENQCAAANEELPYVLDTVSQDALDQQLQLLAGQDALPVQFAGGASPATTIELDEAGHLVDFEEALTDLGVIDNIEPGAISAITSLYGGFSVLPYQYNVEGIWYNKDLFAEHGVDVPTTWDDLVTAAETFAAADIQPFAVSGEQGWPITRLISGYLFRDLGPDALQLVDDGEAELTDPEYVVAAEQVAALGTAGYFGEGVGSVDYASAVSMFLTGGTAMMYMGSWVLVDINGEGNTIGADAVGFMRFPAVEGGAGSIDQMPSNVGLPTTMSAHLYDDRVGAWLGCIAENYGSEALSKQGAITGFRVNTPVEDVPAITEELQGIIGDTTESVLWFEALMGAQAQTTSEANAPLLATGDISPEEFMTLVQADLDAE